eukprot:5172199-Pyramimonas_sp.AAC.1
MMTCCGKAWPRSSLFKCLCANNRLPRRARWKAAISDAVRANGCGWLQLRVSSGQAFSLHCDWFSPTEISSCQGSEFSRCLFLQAIGGRLHVLEQFPQAMSDLVTALQDRHRIVNWDKTGYMTSSVDLDDDLNQRWDLSSEQRLSSGRVLDTEANRGAARSATEQNKRMANAAS